MTMTEILTLSDPIPTGETSSITSVRLIKPRLIHVQAMVLAIGPQVIEKLVAGTGANPTSGPGTAAQTDRDATEEASPQAPVDRKTIAGLISSLVAAERFSAFNEALGLYLGLSAREAEQLSIDDLVAILGKVAGFFPGLAEMAGTLSQADGVSGS